MFIVDSYTLAVSLCVVTMVCWGSHANTLKLTPNYHFSYYYWDQSIGYLIVALILALTMGSFGTEGRSLIEDLSQGSANSFIMALLGGAVFNLANILFIGAVSIAGMAVAFPIGIGIALVEGVIINYVADPKGDATLIFTGVALIALAIIVDALAYGRLKSSSESSSERKGIIFALAGGILMGLFYFLVQQGISADFTALEDGKFGPYAAVVVFALGIVLSNFIFNTYAMSNPFSGDEKATYAGYLKSGNRKNHFISGLGGVINGIGMTFNLIASAVVGDSVAYGLGQGATMVAAIWGVFVWKEFKDAPKGTNKLIWAMFVFYIVGLVLLVISKS